MIKNCFIVIIPSKYIKQILTIKCENNIMLAAIIVKDWFYIECCNENVYQWSNERINHIWICISFNVVDQRCIVQYIVLLLNSMHQLQIHSHSNNTVCYFFLKSDVNSLNFLILFVAIVVWMIDSCNYVIPARWWLR